MIKKIIVEIIMAIFEALTGVFMILTESEKPAKRCALHLLFVLLKFYVQLPPIQRLVNTVVELVCRFAKKVKDKFKGRKG